MRDSATLAPAATPLARARVADYIALTKPRVAGLVLFTVAAGAWLAAQGALDLPALLRTLCGTGLVVGGACALNQLLERHRDALMRRTEARPLPAGRLEPLEVAVFGAVLGVGGIVYLGVLARQPAAALAAGAAFVSYVFVYTPLKGKTTLNTLVGAVPGALPPVIGWAAVRGALDPEAVALFAILFLWQVPHFLAIAWIHRDDYARAGMQMLPVVDRQGGFTGRQMVVYCLALIPVSLAPAFFGLAGPLYAAGALVLGVGFLRRAVGFSRAKSVGQARLVLRASLVYLPALFALLFLDGAATRGAFALWR
jgi:protoheme IX farnesyltransferase